MRKRDRRVPRIAIASPKSQILASPSVLRQGQDSRSGAGAASVVTFGGKQYISSLKIAVEQISIMEISQTWATSPFEDVKTRSWDPVTEPTSGTHRRIFAGKSATRSAARFLSSLSIS